MNMRIPIKYLIVLFFVAFVGARHAVPLQGLAFAATQENGQPCPPECVTDSMEIITYYPSPYGYYEELRGDKIIVGDTDNSRIDETRLPPSGTLTFEPKSYAQITTEGTLYEGTVYYDSFDHEFKYYDNNSSWQPLGGGGGDYWKPSEASGRSSSDIYYNWPGNVGIGVGASDTIGAKLRIDMSTTAKGLIVKSSSLAQTFISGAGQTYRVPPNMTKLRITAYGEKGSGVGGGYGGKTVATVSVAPQETLNVCVNCGGGGAGSPYGGASGGGASYVNRASNYLIVAAGGGGGGGPGGGGSSCPASGTGYEGGRGGGSDGGGGGSGGGGGGGGTQTGGGGGGGGGVVNTSNGYYTGGAVGNAGSGSTGGGGGGGAYCSGCSGCYYGGGGGGGGAGYFGGGGGGGAAAGSYYREAGGGGGGGSNYAISSAINVSMLNGDNPGSGKVIIEPIVAGSIITPASLIEWQDVWGTVLGVVTAEGRVGIKTATPDYTLTVNGTAWVTSGLWTGSDLRWKKNIEPLPDDTIDRLIKLDTIYYNYNNALFQDMHFPAGRQIGLSAQNVEKQFPELVLTDKDGYKAVAYDKLGAVTIEAIKEQQKEIEELKKTARSQQKEIELLKAQGKDKNQNNYGKP